MSKRQSRDLQAIDSVRSVISKLLPEGRVNLEQTAAVLGISARTLQRRLSEQDLEYTRLVDEVRFIKARELILENKKLTDVASQLGYADAGSFTRAFERWTGMTPMQYRKRFYQATQKKQSFQKK